MGKYYVTRKGYDLLYNEISGMDEEHDNVERKMGESVKRDNDLRENPEYMSLRVQAMYGIPAKKRELIQKFNDAIIIEDTPEYVNWDGLTVIRKCKISMKMDGEIVEYTILGSNEGNIEEDILSCNAPLVEALLNHKVGETISFRNIKIEILGVSKIQNKVKKLIKDEK